MPDRERAAGSGLLEQLPTDRLTEQGRQLIGLVAERAIDKAVDSVEELAERLIDYAQHGGPGLVGAITGRGALSAVTPPLRTTVQAGVTGVSSGVKQALAMIPGTGSGGRSGTKKVNITEQIDIGVPLRLAYDQWTRFQYCSPFAGSSAPGEQDAGEGTGWKGQVFWSHPDWETTVIEQVPDERIVWRFAGPKGKLDGAVSFHAMTPTMTRILLVLEYSPQGFLERAGTRCRDQGRRARREIKQFRHHAMIRAVLDPDSVRGWRGEIRDCTVVRTHRQARAAEARERAEQPGPAEAPEPATDEFDTPGQDDYYDDDADDLPEEHDTDRCADDPEADDPEADDPEADDPEADDPETVYDDTDDGVDDGYDNDVERAPARSMRR